MARLQPFPAAPTLSNHSLGLQQAGNLVGVKGRLALGRGQQCQQKWIGKQACCCIYITVPQPIDKLVQFRCWRLKLSKVDPVSGVRLRWLHILKSAMLMPRKW